MAVVRWDAFRDLTSMQHAVNRLFDETLRKRSGESELTGAWAPAVDVLESEDALTINAELPGLKKEDVKVHIDGSRLSISGERLAEREVKEENYHRIERSYGRFSRSFTLPNTVDRAGIAAKMSDGVLQIVLPKIAEAKSREIEVAVE